MSLAGQRIAIAGGGIIGLAAALEFARDGARVSVYERDACMQQSSWAAAGMLAVNDPANDPRLLPLSQLSRALYPGFLAEIERLSGMAVPLRTARTLQAETLTDRFQEPPHFQALDEASLDPRDLCRALPPAARAAGVVVREHITVTHTEVRLGAVDLTLSTGDAIEADRLLLAAGAWSGQLAVGECNAVPVGPCKGQMIEVLLPEDSPPLEHVLRSAEVYLVPRTGRRIVIGATVEYAGFDRSLDEKAAANLLARAGELWPPIRESAVTAQWSGLRPMPEDTAGLPLLGPLDDTQRLWTATGHFRNGILLAPGSARVLAAMMAGKPAPISPSPFDPRRACTPAMEPALP